MDPAPKSSYAGNSTELYGAGLACVIFVYFLISYLSGTVSRAAMAAQLAVQLANTNTPDLGDWYMKQFLLAYVEPGAGFVRKLIFTAPLPAIITCVSGGCLSWIFRKTEWLEFEEGWRFAIGMAVTFLGLMMTLGNGNLLDHVISEIGNVL